MNDQQAAVSVEREVELLHAVIRRVHPLRYKQKERAAVLECAPQLVAPDGSRADAFVVPDVKTLTGESRDLGIDACGIRMRVAYEDIGFVAAISRERFFHT